MEERQEIHKTLAADCLHLRLLMFCGIICPIDENEKL